MRAIVVIAPIVRRFNVPPILGKLKFAKIVILRAIQAANKGVLGSKVFNRLYKKGILPGHSPEDAFLHIFIFSHPGCSIVAAPQEA